MVTGMNLSKKTARVTTTEDPVRGGTQGASHSVVFKHCKRHGQAARPISTRQLRALLLFHTGPIDLVVCKGSLVRLPCGRLHLEAGFTLRCFQRLSRPNVATQLCLWRDNWCTRGSSIPVLSY